MKFSTAKFQIGKNGITPGVIDSLSLVFKAHKQVRVATLKSSGRNRDSIEKIALDLSSKLSEKLGGVFNHTVIGFTIILTHYPKSLK
jgi:RNA-binding protein YhbY